MKLLYMTKKSFSDVEVTGEGDIKTYLFISVYI